MKYELLKLASPSTWWPGYHVGMGPKVRASYMAPEYEITREPGDPVYVISTVLEERAPSGELVGTVTHSCEMPVSRVAEAVRVPERTPVAPPDAKSAKGKRS